jgi:hypothetical protein
MPPGQAAPQSRVPPQPSPIVPQYWPPPAGVQEIFWQLGSPQTPATPRPPHDAGAVQAPQSNIPPQPSPMTPQKRETAALQVKGTQPAVTHSPVAVQDCVAAQAPQSMALPQPFPTLPQYLPVPAWQESATQSGPPTQRPASQI